jgi:hypothetical protein
MRSLKAGASPQQVANAMAISPADVKDCKDKAELDSADESQSGTRLERGESDHSEEPEDDDSGAGDSARRI